MSGLSLTLTGAVGEERQRLRALIEGLGLISHPDLRLGLTNVVVCAGREPLASLKSQVALTSGVPLVGVQWLEDSAQAGRALDWQRYLVPLPASFSTTRQLTPSPERLRAAPEDRRLLGESQFLPPAHSPGEGEGASGARLLCSCGPSGA